MLNNIKPEIWGKHFWNTIYYVVIAYPDNPTYEDKTNIREFFNLLKHILPCENCRMHYSDMLINNTLTDDILNSKENLLNWIININNHVNERLGKPKITYEQIINKYHYGTNSYDYRHIATIILLLLLVIVLLIYVKYRKTN
jgi:hypothetical protein